MPGPAGEIAAAGVAGGPRLRAAARASRRGHSHVEETIP
jgi:hypothetical protein